MFFAKSAPIGVDTKEDYLELKKIMEYKILNMKIALSRYCRELIAHLAAKNFIQIAEIVSCKTFDDVF